MDFMKREGIILIVAVGGFLAAAHYNHYLDRIELEQYLLKKRLSKEQGLSEGLE